MKLKVAVGGLSLAVLISCFACWYFLATGTQVTIVNNSGSPLREVELIFRSGIPPPYSPVRLTELQAGQQATKLLHTEGGLELRFVGRNGEPTSAKEGYVTSMERVWFIVERNDHVSISRDF